MYCCFSLCAWCLFRSKTGRYSRINKITFWGTLSGDIEPFGIKWFGNRILSGGDFACIGIFISDWYLCIDWIVRFCILHKSICILYAAISSYKNWRLYWSFMTWSLYTPFGMERTADGGLTMCIVRISPHTQCLDFFITER